MTPYNPKQNAPASYVRKMGMFQSNIIEELKHPKYEGFLDEFTSKNYSKGQLISRPGNSTNEVFILASGRVRVYLSYEEREFTLCYLEPGDIFSTHTRAFLGASKDTSLLLVSARIFGGKVRAFPELSMLMTDILGEVLGSTLDIIDGLIFHDAKYRLIEFIISLANERGNECERGIEFECDLSIEDISLLIGTTRQTASSLINNLTRNGYLNREGRDKFIVSDFEKLEGLLAQINS